MNACEFCTITINVAAVRYILQSIKLEAILRTSKVTTRHWGPQYSTFTSEYAKFEFCIFSETKKIDVHRLSTSCYLHAEFEIQADCSS